EELHADAHMLPLMSAGGFKHRPDFIRLQIIYGADRAALGRHSQEALTYVDMLRGACREESCERMHGGQARISGRHAVLSVRFEMIQKCQDVFSAHQLDLQIDHGTVMPD